MYRNYEYNSEPLAQGSGQPLVPQRRRPKRPSFFQRAVALVLCAALFGGVAGGSFFARCPFQSLHRPAALLPAAELQTPTAQKYIPRQPRDHIKKAPSRVSFCLGKMVRSDRLGGGRKSEVKETAWWEGRSVQIGKGVPDNPQKAGSAARVLAASQPKQAGLFAEKKAGRSGMRKARSRTGHFVWSAVHSDVG